MILWTWLPALLATSIIADSFAGERENTRLKRYWQADYLTMLTCLEK
jgi:hypothetical protein